MTDPLHNDDFFTEETASAVQLLAQQTARLVAALRDLGNADAATQMGAIEALGVVMKEGMAGIASALSELADAIRAHTS